MASTVISGMRSDLWRNALEEPELGFHRYEKAKREYKQTAALCEAEGFRFVPMVFEAHGGGFSAAVRGVLAWVAEQTAAAHNEEPAAVAMKIAQRISCSLHRENARAILRRAAEPQVDQHPSGWEEAAEPAEEELVEE